MKKLIIFLLSFLFLLQENNAQNYKTYVANLEQNFTLPPFPVNVIKNTLGGTPVFSRNFAGNYNVHLVGAFPIDRTVCFIQSTIYGWAACYRISDDDITIETREVALSINSIDNFLNASAFEIRVYDLQQAAPVIYDTIITLTSPQIQSLFTSPVTLIPSPGANKSIELVQATAKMNFVSSIYVANSTVLLITSTATAPQTAFTAILNAPSIRKANNTLINPDLSSDTQIIANQPLVATTQTTNPTGGDGTLTLRIFYRILDY